MTTGVNRSSKEVIATGGSCIHVVIKPAVELRPYMSIRPLELNRSLIIQEIARDGTEISAHLPPILWEPLAQFGNLRKSRLSNIMQAMSYL